MRRDEDRFFKCFWVCIQEGLGSFQSLFTVTSLHLTKIHIHFVCQWQVFQKPIFSWIKLRVMANKCNKKDQSNMKIIVKITHLFLINNYFSKCFFFERFHIYFLPHSGAFPLPTIANSIGGCITWPRQTNVSPKVTEKKSITQTKERKCSAIQRMDCRTTGKCGGSIV